MDSKERINQFSLKYGTSNIVMGQLLDVNTSSINNWRRGVKEMSEKNTAHFEKVSSILDHIIKRTNYSPERVMSLVLAIKETPNWKGWDSLDKEITNPFYLKKASTVAHNSFEEYVIKNLSTILPDLKLLQMEPSGGGFDALAQNALGQTIAIEVKAKKVEVETLGKILHYLAQTESLKITEVVLIAPDFSKSFLETIKTIPKKITTKKINISLSDT